MADPVDGQSRGIVVALRERKLVQWALAYAAAAFALLQGIDIVAQRFAWPEPVERLLIVALCIGFFVVLVLAWYHGERGAQKVSATELTILTLLLAIGGGMLWRFAATGPAPAGSAPAGVASASATAAAAAPTAVPDKSIAVLPFENLSSDKENEYFASGMQDMILTKLSEIAELRVASRTSTQKYKSHPDDIRTIAQTLGVAHVLEGSVQKAGNRVLINLQLIDAATDKHLWAQSYTRTLDNIFGVEGEVAQTVADALKAKLSPAEVANVEKVGTRNKEAYDLFLRALYFLDNANRSGDYDNLKRSIELANPAIALDPEYVRPYTVLALDYDKLGGHTDEQEAAARKALSLEPGSAQAQRQMAYVLSVRGDPAGALEHMREAVRLAPGEPSMSLGLGFTLADDGRMEEAAEAFARAIELDPRVNFYKLSAGELALYRRRYAQALDLFRHCVASDPDDLPSVAYLSETWRIGFGDLPAARKALEAASAPASRSGTLARRWFNQYLLERDFTAAVRVVEQAPQNEFDNSRIPKGSYVGRAERAQGHVAQARAAFSAARTGLEGWLKSDPKNAQLHARLALVLAGLGEFDAALREAEQAQTLNVIRRLDSEILVALAQVQAFAGHPDDAFATLEKLSTMPSGMDISSALLRLDPDWDVLRNDPRFGALVSRFAEAEKAASR